MDTIEHFIHSIIADSARWFGWAVPFIGTLALSITDIVSKAKPTKLPHIEDPRCW